MGFLALGAAQAAWADDQEVAAADQASGGVETVTVTARQRAENVQDVPIALTAISAEQLAESGIDQLSQIQFAAPSLSVYLINPRNAQLSIRGIGNNPANDGLSSSVGIYVDGVYLGRPGMATNGLNDIDSIEVLRGPQGTLFGKNTTAGALNITTNKPTFTPEASSELSAGSYDTVEFKGVVSGPLTDQLAGRFLFYDDTHAGYIQSPNGGPYDDLGREGLRGQLLWQPNGDLTFRWIADYGYENDHSGFQDLYSPGSPKASIPFSTWTVGHGVTAILDPTHPWTTNSNEPQIMKASNWGSSLQGDWNVPGGYTLTSITAVRNFTFSPINNSGFTVYAPAATSPVYSSNANDRDTEASQELRLASPLGGDIDYVAGLYYFWNALDGRQRNYYGNLYSILTGASNAPFNNATLSYDSFFRTTSAAAYGQANWHISPQLTLTAGLRESYEADQEQFNRSGLTGGTGTPPSSTIPYSGSGSIKNWSTGGLITLAYKLTDDLLIYGTLSHGAKAGGFVGASTPTQTGTSFAPFSTLELKPESSDDAELGVKSSWLDNRLILNADAFYTRVGNYQLAATVTSPNGIAAAGSNVQSLTSKGFEVELTALPFDGLSVTASSSYNDATYGSFPNAPSVQGATAKFQDLTGRPVNGVPLWTGSVSATYTVPLAENTAGYFTADYAYKSGQYGYVDDSPYSWIKAYGLANFRAGVNFGQYDVAVWVRNAFNTPNFDVVGTLSGGVGGYYADVGAPRVFGGTVQVKF